MDLINSIVTLLRKEITNVGWVDVDIESSISSSKILKQNHPFTFVAHIFKI